MKSLGKGSISIILILFIILSNASAQDPPTDYSENDLLAKGISSNDVAKLMSLPSALRVKRVDEMQTIQQEIQDKGLRYSVGYTDKFLLPDEYRARLFGVPGTPPAFSENPPASLNPGSSAFPTNFDLRDQNAVTPVKDQGLCGSCWAFASVAVLEGVKKKYDGTELDLSEQELVSCTAFAHGCMGGWVNLLFGGGYLQMRGVVDEACFPYAADDLACSDKCDNPTTLFKPNDTGIMNPYTPYDQIKNAIYNYGPVAIDHCVDNGFLAYTGGIYECTGCNSLHSTAIVGWGKEDDDYYWIVKNSWGTGWGEQGYIKMKIGSCLEYRFFTSYASVGETTPTTTGTTISTSTTLPTDKCTDTDGGKIFDVFGIASGINAVKEDKCKGRKRLKEAYCKKKKAKYKKKKCRGKCELGQCVKSSDPCTDTDINLNDQYRNLGWAIDSLVSIQDKCKNKKKLLEAICNNVNKAVYKKHNCGKKYRCAAKRCM